MDNYEIESKKGKVLSVTCKVCECLVPFVQPATSKKVEDVILVEHACPLVPNKIVEE